MEARELENKLKLLLNQDFSEGTEAFRDELLARCLDVLRSDASAVDDIFDPAELDDSTLDLLAAAGDPSLLEKRPFQR